MTTPVDNRFDPGDFVGDDPSTLPPAPSRPFVEDPPELKARLVSAIGGEVTDEALTPGEFRAFRQETIDILERLAAGQETINKQLMPLVIDHGRRLTIVESRADKTDDWKAKTDDRVARHERDLKAVIADVAKLKEAAARRARKT